MYIQGDQISEDDPISLPFYHRVGLDHSMVFTHILFECEGKSPPKYGNQKSNRESSGMCAGTWLTPL